MAKNTTEVDEASSDPATFGSPVKTGGPADKQEEGEQGELGMLATFAEHSAQTEDEPAKKPVEATKEPGKPAEKAEGDPKIEGYEEVDTDIPSSPVIKAKFSRFKENEKALVEATKKAIAEAQAAQAALEEAKAAPKESDEDSKAVKEAIEALKRERDAAVEHVERLRFEESPRFKEKYDARRDKLEAAGAALLRGIDDPDKAKAVGGVLYNAIRMEGGMDTEEKFYRIVNSVTSSEEVPEHVKSPLYAKLVEIRGVQNEKAQALAEWRTSKEEFDREAIQQQVRSSDQVTSEFDAARRNYEAINAERLKVYRDPDAGVAFQYDDLVNPLVERSKQELANSVATGKPTRGLVDLLNRGAEIDFQANLNRNLLNTIADLDSKLKEAESRLSKIKNGGSGGGRPATGTQTPKQGGDSGSGILDTYHAQSR